jgi:hypothetical protein
MRHRSLLRQNGSRKIRRWNSTFVAGALLLGTVPGIALGGAGAAAADTGPAPATATPAPHTADPQTPPLEPLAPQDDDGLTAAQRQAMQTAKDQAAASGQPVLVDALTTATTTTTANPDGALTVSSSLLPTRVHRESGWVPVDATLVRNADGTYAPAAASAALTLSGGGSSAPLAAMGSGTERLSFGWPTALPAPVAAGDTLTYPDVLPDVDLKVTATTLGGFCEVLVVKSAAAATDPALTTLTLAMHASGVTVRDDEQDNLAAVTPNGEIAFSAPSPIMWDSARTADAPATVKAPASTATTETAQAAATDPVTPQSGPPPGAHVANVGTAVTSQTLTLTPDRNLLTGPGTVYPVYIDPDWSPHPASGSRQHWNEVQAACPGTSNWDSTAYGDPGVGNNTYSGCVGVERSYFQLSVPSSVFGTHIVSAVINVTETYAAQCDTTSTINMYQTSLLKANFTWNSKPAAGTSMGSHSFGPACTSFVSGGYSATSAVARAAAGHTGSLAYVLINANESSGYHFKRFAANPNMNITYNHVPNTPGSLTVRVNAASYNCAVAGTTYPVLGKTVATTPPTLDSVVSDTDKDVVQARYSFWVGSGTPVVLYSHDVSSGQHAPAALPASFISGLADGTVVNWQVSVSDGKDTKTNASTCHFTVDQRAPAEPSVTSNNGLYPDISADGGPGAPAGTPGTFTAKVNPGTTGNNASKFVFGLDAAPPSVNPPAAQVVTATNNSAAYQVTPVAPGTHTLYVYALDSANNASATREYHFTAVGHTETSYASLSAAFDNTAVTSDTAQSSGNADGNGYSFSKQDLQTAGWQPGQKITVDGASFTLPNFGSGSADNVLAANQKITMNNQHGNALVFLATSTFGGSASDHNPADYSSPYVPDDTPVSATGCTFEDNRYTECSEASGTVTYADSTTSSQSYYLPVPDWDSGPSAPAVVVLPHRNGPSGQTALPRKIYAFAVPITPGVPISSVTLPDLSDTAHARVPGLHIFAMAVRDTASAPNGAGWTGAWSDPIDTAYRFGSAGFANQTFRTILTPSIGGDSARIRLSNSQGLAPLTIDDATVAGQTSPGAGTGATPVRLTFNGGSTSVTIPVGGEIYSDPVAFPVMAAQALVVSFHLATTADYLVMHTNGSASVTYVSAANSGDHAMDTSGSSFSGTGSIFFYGSAVTTGVDVSGAARRPTVAVLGDGLYNVTGSTLAPSAKRVSDNLADALRTNDQGIAPAGVIATGIPNNFVAQDKGPGGLAALTRLDRDVLSAPGITTAVIYEGNDDILTGANDAVVTNAYQLLRDQLEAWGIRSVFLTLTPCGGNSLCSAAVEDNRVTVNDWISDQLATNPPGVANADANAALAIDDPNSTTNPPLQKLSTGTAPLDFDAGDHVNLTADGYAAVSRTLTDDLTVLFPAAT